MSIITKSLEKIPSFALEQFSFLLKDLIGKEQGIYALYKGKILYYTGKSIDLQSRLKQHLNDRHKRKWDTFSLFIVRDKRHISDLESLLITIHKPKGNSQNPRIKAKNLLQDYKNLIENFKAKMLGNIHVCKKQKKSKNILPVLATYKGMTYYAKFNCKTHSVQYNNITYSSPSAAGNAITRRSTNGLLFWKVEDETTKKLLPLKRVI